MKNYFLLLIIGLTLVCSFFIFGCETNKSHLPNDIVITLYSDMISSGASREVNARILFEDGILGYGYADYTSDDTLGVHSFYECVAERYDINGSKGTRWINATVSGDEVRIDGSQCDERLKFIPRNAGDTSYADYPPFTIKEYQGLIDDGTLVLRTNKTSCHDRICYETEPLREIS
ncbi:MAG: hypothetical protein NTX24_04655 [Candidatus Pacearchaeota archaeon]|nr:hypothetical protein [Candidatus Pacearchaeota archaeon]